MELLRISAVQMDIRWHDAAANRQRIVRLLSEQADSPDLILLPEMFTSGFTMEADDNFEEMDGPTMNWMQELAATYDAWVGGSIIIREDGSFYNRFLLMSKEGLVMEYDKRHLFRLAGEHDYYEAGEEWGWFQYKGWNIVPMICYDLRFPVWARNRAKEDGSLSYDLLIYVANWPTKRVSHWEALLRARAIENQSFTIGVNRVGIDGKGYDYSGSSMIIDPYGEELAYNSGDEIVLNSVLDPAVLENIRTKLPFWKDADNFDLYM